MVLLMVTSHVGEYDLFILFTTIRIKYKSEMIFERKSSLSVEFFFNSKLIISYFLHALYNNLYSENSEQLSLNACGTSPEECPGTKFILNSTQTEVFGVYFQNLSILELKI